MNKKIAILATGDEITQGSVVNTNAQKMAHEMFSYGIDVEWHISVPDDESAIQEALRILLEKHAVVITIGGLGPTSDDKTRFALANYLKEPLVVDNASFESLAARYKAMNLPFTELSKQQTLFPKNSEVLNNIHGSANGCFYEKKMAETHQKSNQQAKNSLEENHQWIFMLPGPPHECLPMFQAYILPRLTAQFSTGNNLFQWKVFGVAEGLIAEKMDTALKPFASLCRTSFCWNYPYVDCKVLLAESLPEKEQIITLLNNLLLPYQLDPLNNQAATERLKNYLKTYEHHIFIDDKVTGGILESRLRFKSEYLRVHFDRKTPVENGVYFRISGLFNYWKGEEEQDEVYLESSREGTKAVIKTIATPIRKIRLEEYVAELLAHEIYGILTQKSS